jgi:methionyl-tRNA formyltransferase
MSKDLRIIFIGTPDFAAYSLTKLVNAGKNIVAVITAPDRPAGRGMQLHQSAVKVAAIQHGIPVLQPEKLKDPLFLATLASYKADFQIVIAFRMLPELVWNMPPLGTMNLHASLLPDYRGAAPINWAIINGETKSGITTFLLKHQIDTGDILLQKEVAIAESDNVGVLYEKLMHQGADLVLESTELIEKGDYKTIPQKQNEHPKHAPKIFKETCEIDWNNSAKNIINLVRGLSPYPAARCTWQNKILKVYACEVTSTQNLQIGEFESDGKTYLRVGAKDADISLIDVQLEGRKRMLVEELLRGYQIH